MEKCVTVQMFRQQLHHLSLLASCLVLSPQTGDIITNNMIQYPVFYKAVSHESWWKQDSDKRERVNTYAGVNNNVLTIPSLNSGATLRFGWLWNRYMILAP